ncbi:MAG: hypothetical protein WBX02_05425 [Terriglobales bacterium]
MRRVALAVMFLSLEVAGWGSPANSRENGVGQESLARPSEPGSGSTSPVCPNGISTRDRCDNSTPPGITYATTADNWIQTIAAPLTGGTQTTVTLTPCPTGIDTTSGVGYQVLISGSGNSEAVDVRSGSCRSGASSGTITFIPFFSYPARSTVGSASSGIQETLNAACGVDATWWNNGQCNVTVAANGPGYPIHSLHTYRVAGTIFFHSNQSVLQGYGVSLDCVGRRACIQVGNLTDANKSAANTIKGFTFRAPINRSAIPPYAGVNIASTVRTAQVVTIATASPHGFRPGDMITILFTDDRAYWGDAVVTAVPSSTTFQYAHSGGDIALQTTPGVVALAYSAILDNGHGTHLIDISADRFGEEGAFNNFLDIWDDENCTIDHLNNNGNGLNNSATWVGSWIFSAGNQGAKNQIAPVISLLNSTITARNNGVTVYNSNGLYIENTVLQATSLWQVYSSNSTGNYQGAYLKNIYSESGARLNPLTPPRSPFPGLGIAGLIAGPSTGAANFQIVGSGTFGEFPSGGAGSKPYSYFIVANDATARTQTSPMQILNWRSNGKDSIPVRWPRVANGTDAITYDVIRMATPAGVGSFYPSTGACSGGSGGACGYVAQGLTQSAACSGSLVCTYTDDGASSTSPYATSPGTHPKPGNYTGNLVFWPGSIVSVFRSVSVDVEESPAVGVGLNGNPLQIAKQCSDAGNASPGAYTECEASITTPNNAIPNQTAMILNDGASVGSGMTLTKGRLNFSSTPEALISAHHFITLLDSQPALTKSTWGYRPPAAANDTWIGTDVAGSLYPSAGQLAFGAPVSITNYIHATGDGVHANWLERLTAKDKTFAVPVKIKEGNSFTLGDGSPLSQMKLYRVNAAPASPVPAHSCIDVNREAKGLTKSDQVTSITPPGRLGNLSVNAYPADEGMITLHFCNPSNFEVSLPTGTYSFLAVR